jgi:hypothetical protein
MCAGSFLDDPVPVDEDFQVATHLAPVVAARGPHVLGDPGVVAAWVPRHELQHDVVSATELVQEPVVRLGPQRGRAVEEHPPEDVRAARGEDALFEAVTIELRHPFEERPEEQQPLRLESGMGMQDLGHGHTVVERCVAVLEDRRHLRVQRAQDDEASRNSSRLPREQVDLRLQVRAEHLDVLPVEVLELVQGHDEARPRHRRDEAGELLEVQRPRKPGAVDAEHVHRIGNRRQDPCRTRVGDLDVEDFATTCGPERLLDQGRLSDSAPTGDLAEEPTPTAQDSLELVELAPSAVEAPGHGGKTTFFLSDAMFLVTYCE